MSSTWFRVCVDLDAQGNPVGTSYEHHVDQETVSFGTGPLPGPFDSPAEAFDAVLLAVIQERGVQARLL